MLEAQNWLSDPHLVGFRSWTDFLMCSIIRNVSNGNCGVSWSALTWVRSEYGEYGLCTVSTIWKTLSDELFLSRFNQILVIRHSGISKCLLKVIRYHCWPYSDSLQDRNFAKKSEKAKCSPDSEKWAMTKFSPQIVQKLTKLYCRTTERFFRNR